MKVDHLSYKRAANFSLLGMALQFALGLALLIYSVLAGGTDPQKKVVAGDHAATTASLFILSGVFVWLILAVVFDQHRRERLEAMEAESLAAEAARQSTVFEEHAEDLRVAHKRLAWMHKFLVPGSSLALAALLILVGLARLSSGRGLVSRDAFPMPNDAFRPWEVVLGLVLAAAGFLYARWIAGMAKQAVWANLRAGATQAVGMALMGLAMAVGQFVDMAGPDTVLRYLQLAFPIAMIVLGAETVLNFVLAVYQPRKPGEMPRPAFDSRILGFVAAPDKIAESIGGAINYQFGFEVTGSWFYQLLSRSIVALVLVGAGVVWAMTLVAVVGPDERGLRVRNGTFVEPELGPGAYLKYPWPFEEIERYKATMARRLDLASPAPAPDKPILWTNEHVTDEANYYLFCRPPAGGPSGVDESGQEAEYKDLAMVSLEAPVYYAVTDVHAFETRLGPPETREARLKAIGQQELLRYMATVRLDDILGAGRARASDEIARLIRARFDGLHCGVKVLFVGIEGIHPPTTTAANFEQVVGSEQSKLAIITKAEGDRIETLARAAGSVEAAERFLAGNRDLEAMRARGETGPALIKKEEELVRILSEGQGSAAAIIRGAKTERWAKHMEARGRAEGYKGQLSAYRASPALYTSQLYFDTLRAIMGASRVYIVSDEVEVTVRVNNEDVDSANNPLTAPKEAEPQ